MDKTELENGVRDLMIRASNIYANSSKKAASLAKSGVIPDAVNELNTAANETTSSITKILNAADALLAKGK